MVAVGGAWMVCGLPTTLSTGPVTGCPSIDSGTPAGLLASVSWTFTGWTSKVVVKVAPAESVTVRMMR